MENNVISRSNHVLFTIKRPDVVMCRGEGLYLWDTAGKKYLDFIGGWAVNSLGHSPKVIEEALTRQSKVLVNASPAYLNEPMLAYADRLAELSGFDRIFFMSTGAEANESAIKLARKYGAKAKAGAYEIIAMEGGFHGRTLATMSATGKPAWRSMFEPKIPGFRHVPLNDLDAVEAAISEKTVAIMLEPIQGEGGVYEATEAYLHHLRRLCEKHNLLLIYDEVQTGFGRTGKLFAFQNFGVCPDIMTLGKGIGSGFPLSAMLTSERLNIFEAGEQGGTYTAQPLAMAVGLAVLNEIVAKNLCDNALIQGNRIQEKLTKLAARLPLVNVRGRGLLVGVDLTVGDAFALVSACFEAGLILNATSTRTIRIIPPLIVSDAEVDACFRIFESVASDYFSRLK